jgi:hypothetical protein
MRNKKSIYLKKTRPNMCILAIDFFFGMLTLILGGHQVFTFFFNGIKLPNIIIDFIIVWTTTLDP